MTQSQPNCGHNLPILTEELASFEQPSSCRLSCSAKAQCAARIPSGAKILLSGDSTTHRTFEHIKAAVGGCSQVRGASSQAGKYPQGDAGIKAGAGVHYKCARSIELWFHAFTKAEVPPAPPDPKTHFTANKPPDNTQAPME